MKCWNILAIYGEEGCVLKIYGEENCVLKIYGEENWLLKIYREENWLLKIYGGENWLLKIYGEEGCVLKFYHWVIGQEIFLWKITFLTRIPIDRRWWKLWLEWIKEPWFAVFSRKICTAESQSFSKSMATVYSRSRRWIISDGASAWVIRFSSILDNCQNAKPREYKHSMIHSSEKKNKRK